MPKPGLLYYYVDDDQVVAGPFDLVQMAALLRRRTIDADTMTLCDGEMSPTPFSHRPDYATALEMSPDAVSENLERIKAEGPPGMLPRPSREFSLQIAKGAGLLLALAVIVFFISYLAPPLGVVLLVVGIAACAIGHCLILAKLLDEDIFTLLAIWFIPLYDIFFFISNIDAYFTLLRVKYVGAVVMFAAGLGLALNSSLDAHDIFHFFGH